MGVISKEDLINKVGDPKVLPFVARKILETLNNEDCTINDLSAIIEKDQAIAARVLKISNSALYGLRHEVASLRQAIVILGLRTIRSLVLSVSTRALYKNFGMKEKILWDHSVGAAIASKMISAGLGAEVGEVSFIGGLMHDFGKTVMNNESPDVFGEVMMNVYNEENESIAAEEEMYGFNHAEIGARVIEKWGFNFLLVNILEKHHLMNIKLEGIDNPTVAKSVAVVNLADHMCRYLGIGYRNPNETIQLHELPSSVFLKFGKNALDRLAMNIQETYNREKSVFD